MSRTRRLVVTVCSSVCSIVAVWSIPALGQSVQYKSPAGIEYRSPPDTGPIARAKAALDADHPQRPGHFGLRDLDDAGGRLLGGQPEPIAQPLQGLPREIRGQHDLAAEGRPVGQVAEQQVRVGDGRLVAAETVRGRPGIGPGRTGTDPQGATLVGPRHRTPARAGS